MRLKISDLQRVVETALKEKNEVENFCNEIKRVFGPTVVVSDDVVKLSEQANDRLNVLERTGRKNSIQFSRSIAQKLSTHESSEVRKLVARVLPVDEATKLVNDKSHTVRIEAAKRAPLAEVKRSIARFPNDVALKEVYSSRLLSEKNSALEASAKGPEEDFMSDTWYEKSAKKLVQDYYAAGLDTGWVNSAVNQVVLSNRATNRFNVDSMKLYKTVLKLLADREELMEEEALKESKVSLPPVELADDPVESLNESTLSASEYIEKANSLFNVKFSVIPPGLKKHRLGENYRAVAMVPTVAFLPHKRSIRYEDETALDKYTKCWNMQQRLSGEPYKLSWSPHPDAQNKISFHLELK